MDKINLKEIILMLVGGVMLPFLTEVVTPYILKDWHEPIYSVSKYNELFVYDGTKPENISMVIDDTVRVETNVYLYEIVFWNNGKKEILKSDVRSPIVIVPSENTHFASIEIINSTEPEISGFYLMESDIGFTVNWNYFEPNFGFKVRAIVMGEENGAPIIKGYVPGHRVKEVNLSFEPLHKTERIILAILYFFLSVLLIYSLITLLKRKKYDWNLLGTSILLIAFVFYRIIYYFIYSYHPPDTLY